MKLLLRGSACRATVEIAWGSQKIASAEMLNHLNPSHSKRKSMADSFASKGTLKIDSREYTIFRLAASTRSIRKRSACRSR